MYRCRFPGPGEALVKVQAVGICASDLKCFHGAPMYWGDGPVPPNVDLLATPGHEFVGEIVAVDDLGASGGAWTPVIAWWPNR